MELRDYIKIILKYKAAVLLITLILAIGGYWWAARQPATVDGSVTFTVVNSERFPADQYGYDYYFTIQSSALLADTIDGWFGSPSFTSKIYDNAKVALPSDTTRAAGRIFRSVKEIEKSPVIVVSAKTQKRSETENLIKSAGELTKNEVDQLIKNNKLPNTFSLLVSEPLILEAKPKPHTYGVAGLVVGLILGSVLALGLHYFKEG